MNYNELFRSVLLELAQTPSSTTPAGTPKTSRPRYDTPSGAIDSFLDDDTNPAEFSTDDGGLKEKIEEIRNGFEQEVARMAEAFSPEKLSDMNLGELRRISDNATSALGSIQNHFKPKPGEEYKRSAVIANDITRNADKETAFNDLTNILTEFNASISELEVAINNVSTKFGVFIKTLQKPMSDEELEDLIPDQEQGLNDSPETGDSSLGKPPASPLR
jgi:uncharacterized phage infection (PIP) family protein YhgE